jgi:cytochrome c6
MKKILSLLLLVIAIFTLTFNRPALAQDINNGAKIFSANCAVCHAGGRNTVNPAKTLKQQDLDKYEMNSAEAIIYQVTNGKQAMPAFKGRLKPEQIEDVTAYVLDEANNKDWK